LDSNLAEKKMVGFLKVQKKLAEFFWGLKNLHFADMRIGREREYLKPLRNIFAKFQNTNFLLNIILQKPLPHQDGVTCQKSKH
jgi:hypothetical protein